MTEAKTQRYHRQTILPEIGMEGQARLAQSRVLVVGAGGLGCPALQYLAGAGIGTIGIIDHDRVDITNIHRQILFHTRDTGRPKAAVARERLLGINSEITIHAYEAELTDQNAPGLFAEYDIVIDGTDNFPAKFLINDVAVKLGKPVIYGAIQGFEGQVSVFDAARSPCYRCLFPQPPQDAVMNCAEAGVIGALAGLIGTMQAMEAIKLIVGHDSFAPLTGILWMIDSRTIESRRLEIPKRHDCPLCSRPAHEIIPQYASPVCSVAMVRDIAGSELEKMTGIVMIDVREQEEWDMGHIQEAIHIPLSVLREDTEAFAPHRHKTCVLYCQRGMRSHIAAEILLNAGFPEVYSLKGGYEEWAQSRG